MFGQFINVLSFYNAHAIIIFIAQNRPVPVKIWWFVERTQRDTGAKKPKNEV